jgi:hypothetical protein
MSKTDMNNLRRIIYTSQSVIELNKQAMLTLLHDARSYNAIDDITGVLLQDKGRFLQVIEGPEKPVENLLQRLKNDTRHNEFHIYEDIITQVRLFSDWKMGFGDLQVIELSFLPGIASESEQQDKLLLLVDRLPELAKELHFLLDQSS